MNKLEKLFTRFRFIISRFSRPKPKILERQEGWLPIRVPIAGVMHKKQYIAVSELSLLEKATLIREPKNEYDTNAIMVIRQDGKRLGYIGRTISLVLAPFMDVTNKNLQAVVTDITSDVSSSVIGASICFYLPEKIYRLFYSKVMRDIDFFIEKSSDNAVYLFINCDEGMLNHITNLFSTHNLDWVRSGLSYRPASDGVQYRWYIRFLEGIAYESINNFLRKDLLIIPYQERVKKELDEYIKKFDSENVDLKQKHLYLQEIIQKLKEENDLLKSQIIDLERSRSGKWNVEIKNIIKELLPNLELKRDSIDVISQEVKNDQQIFKILHSISSFPENLKGVRVKATKNWLEKHFYTGEKDNGRIYYKKVGEKWEVLISDKKSQPLDLHWLQKN